MTEKGISENELKRRFRYLEPAFYVTLITGAIFYAGWKYVDAFLEGLTIDHDSLEIPTFYYLIQGFLPALIITGVTLLTMMNSKEAPSTRRRAFQGNILAFALCILLAEWYVRERSVSLPGAILFLSLAITTLSITAVATFRKESISHYLRKTSILKQFGMFVLLLVFFSLAAEDYGYFRAEKLLGVSPVSRLLLGKETYKVIEFTLIEGSRGKSIIEGKKYIYIIHNGSNYYVMEKFSKPPVILIVPDDQVALARTEMVTAYK